jgi:hypothetical protein
MRHFTNKEKERILTTSFYHEIMGKTTSTLPLIDIQEVYPNRLDLSCLSRPFSTEEIHKALKHIPRDKSLGPDGFGSAFYRDFWDITKVDILNIFNQFFNECLQLERNNRSYIVLIQKKEDSCSLDAYRPISLLNCPIKLITKVLALRLQDQIQNLIDDDQTGFVCNRCIADNFVYALDLVQTCKLRKKKNGSSKTRF